MILPLVNFVKDMRIALSGLDIFQRFIIHLENAEKQFCNSNLRNSGDHLESDLNMVSLQKFETNSFTAFFSSEMFTTLWIGIFMLKCSKSRIFHSQSFDISSSIFQRSFLRTFVSKMGLSADSAASYRCFQFIISSFIESVHLQLGHSRKSHVIFDISLSNTFDHFSFPRGTTSLSIEYNDGCIGKCGIHSL